MRYLVLILIIIVLSLLLFQQCESEPKIINKTKTLTKTKIVRDTVEKVVVGKPEKVYIRVTDTIYKDSIVYLSDTLKVNRYPLSLLSNKAKFEGFALTDGKIYDFDGVISYPQTTVTENIERIIKRDKSGFFGFIQANTQLNNLGVGLDWQLKNNFIFGTSITHNTMFQDTNINFKLGIKL